MIIEFGEEATDALTEALGLIQGYTVGLQWFDGKDDNIADVEFTSFDFEATGDMLQLWFRFLNDELEPDQRRAPFALSVDQIEHLHIY